MIFNYSVKKLYFFLKEEVKIMNIIKDIEQEYQANMDNFSKPITISYIETLLSFSERFTIANSSPEKRKSPDIE